MLDQQDLKAISGLLDEKFKENNQKLKEEIVDEVGTLVNVAFAEHEASDNEKFEGIDKKFESIDKTLKELKDEIAKRPTRNDFSKWADGNIVDLQLRADRIDYIHMDDLDKLPSQPEISQALLARGLKKKQEQATTI